MSVAFALLLIASAALKLYASRLLAWEVDYVPVLARGQTWIDGGAFPVVGTLSSVAAFNMPFLVWMQLPALLVIPVELDADRLFRERKDSLQTAAFSGGAKSVYYGVTHLLLAAPADAGLGLRSHLPRLVDLIDAYTAALSADVTLGDQLLAPARVSVEPGSFPYGEREFYGCAFRHTWLLEI